MCFGEYFALCVFMYIYPCVALPNFLKFTCIGDLNILGTFPLHSEILSSRKLFAWVNMSCCVVGLDHRNKV